ncbi:hypothetical protein ACFSJU_08680 [Paradesertivirga mongoliensis]|uniref:Pectinesterase n=1 Tax=Paradesertivirga mongoliensis TaxID=2100740 RepID=A0ABW4ZKR8_9SPHI|nr:hypothetical protein [Pedobacter mongoliensis]
MKLNLFLCILLFAAGVNKSIANNAAATTLSNSKPITEIKFRGKTIKLSEKAIYINAKLHQQNMGKYSFKTLQDAVKFAKSGTELHPTVLYLEPDVYWTDDPKAENKENKLIGLAIPQANITMIGLSENAEHTIIAGNRGQMAGAIGNWNTLGVGDGFKAYNITFGNYCNVDLVYPLDPSKNHPKRQKTITQAQVLTTAYRGDMDKWIFDNCRFISFLNTFAAGREPHRAYYTKCFFQCTDDAIGSGDISVFDRVNFKFYSNHPSWGGSSILQAYLGCNFETVLRDPGANSTLFFAKNNNIFAVIDCQFNGNATKLEWTDHPSDNARHVVHNNTLNKQNTTISTGKPELSVKLNSKSLQAFKVANEYNVYNLLRGDDDWDPAKQKTRLAAYSDLPYRLQLKADKIKLNPEEKASVSYLIYPERVRHNTPVTWSVSNPKVLSLEKTEDGSIRITGHNNTDQTLKASLKAETSSGIEALIHFEIAGTPLPPPAFSQPPMLGQPKQGSITLVYSLDLKAKVDDSQIDWYRAYLANGSDSVKVGISRPGSPLKTFNLSSGDIGYYVLARIKPKHTTSLAGQPVWLSSRKIKSSDVSTHNIHTNFKSLPTRRNSVIKDGFWTLDTHRPADLSAEFEWEPGQGDAWTYGTGTAGATGRYGILTVQRGARLLYAQQARYGDMSITVELSPQKAAGQGFGSATGQYLDIYTKFDPHTLTGYGLRIERTPLHGEGVQFTLYKFINGAGTPITKSEQSSAFLPGCKVVLNLNGKVLSAKVSTTSPQQQSQKDAGLKHEVNLSATISENSFGGFGIQTTGSTSEGNKIMLERISIVYPGYD